MPRKYPDDAVAAGRVSLLPQEVKNLLALYSLQARWFTVGGGAVQSLWGFRIYSQKVDMSRSASYVCVSADADLDEWIDGVRRWERIYGPRL